MQKKVLNVFYGEDNLPYKDVERTVHYPLLGTGFTGASDTTEIRFYVDQIGGVDTTKWVANTKLPNGKKGYKLLESERDSTLGENYVSLSLTQFYTQVKGDVYISLQGYDGGVVLSQDEDDNYIVVGTPIIQATGSIKITMQYAVNILPSDIQEYITLDDILAYITGKADVSYVKENYIPRLKVDVDSTTYTADLYPILSEYGFDDSTVGNTIIFSLELTDLANESATDYIITITAKEDSETEPPFGSSYVKIYDLTNHKLGKIDDLPNGPYTLADIFDYATFEDIITESGLDPYYTKTQIDNLLNNKVSRVSQANKIYATSNSGSPTTLDYGTGTTGSAIVQRDSNGQVNVPDTPSDNNDAASKGYVLGQVQTKQDLLVSGTNIKTINNQSILGSGNIEIQGGGGSAEWGEITGTLSNQTDLQNELQSLHQEAEGKCKSYTISITDNASFNSQNAYISGVTSIKDTSGNTIQVSSLNNGDVILVIETEVPDRWYSPSDGKFYVLETTKVDLSGYVDLTSNQTIVGNKTFSGDVDLYNVYVLQPKGNNSRDIGSASRTWKDIYFAGDLNPNSSGYGYTLPSTTSFTSDKTIASVEDLSGFNAYSSSQTYAVGDKVVYGGKLYRCSTAITTAESWDSTHWTEITLTDFVDTFSNQTISGTKTIVNELDFKYQDNSTVLWKLTATGDFGFIFRRDNQSLISFVTTQGLGFDMTLYPVNTGKDLGKSTNHWQEGYIDKITDTNGSYSSDNVFNVINASDIVNNTLTQEQLAIFTNGKPTLVKGEFLSMKNPLFLTGSDLYVGAGYYGVVVGSGVGNDIYQTIGFYRINTSNVIGVVSAESNKRLNVSNIGIVNGKVIPSYPSSTGTFVLKCVDGTLTWVQES